MPRKRFIEYQGQAWRLTHLAREHGLAPATLAARLDRFPQTSTGIRRALSTGLISPSVSGRMGALRSSWRRA